MNELDGREPADAILAREGAGGGVVRVEVGDFAPVVAVKGRGDLGPDGFEGFAVPAPRCEKGDEGALGLGCDDAVGAGDGGAKKFSVSVRPLGTRPKMRPTRQNSWQREQSV